MTVEEQADGSLVLTYDSVRWSRFVFVLAAALGVAALSEYFDSARETDRIVGLLVGALASALAGIALLEQAHVVVDPSSRTIRWSRRWAFRRRAGTLRFADVTGVIAERPMGDDGVPSRRIVLRTAGGEMIPLTAGYRPDHGDVILAASERISALIGPATPGPRSIEPLVAAGRLIDAVRLLRETEGLSLEEAKRRVEALRSRR